MKYIAYTVKGLEKIAASEIQELLFDAMIEEVDDKRIIFETDAPFERIVTLTTIDDLGILITKKDQINSVDQIIDSIKGNTFYSNLKNLDVYRQIKIGEFSLTISVANSKTISAKDVGDSIRKTFEEKFGWKYLEKDHSNIDFRFFLDKDILYISIRLTQKSLHHRAYKIESQEGSLRPTVAAAMVRLATSGESGLKLVDTFCGSGTILCETLLAGEDVYGGDIDPDAIAITNLNLSQISSLPPDRIKVQSATNTKFPAHFFDVAISNLPWDKQIAVSSITDLYIASLHEYKRILKEESTLCVLVTKPELFIKHAKSVFKGATIKTYPISFTGQSPTIIVITTHEYNP